MNHHLTTADVAPEGSSDLSVRKDIRDIKAGDTLTIRGILASDHPITIEVAQVAFTEHGIAITPKNLPEITQAPSTLSGA